MNGLKAIVTAATHVGAQRETNEDAVVLGDWVAAAPCSGPTSITVPPGASFVCAVADGLGGHAAGEVASNYVARGLAALAGGIKDASDLKRALVGMNSELFDQMDATPDLAGMGTTVAGLLFLPDEVVWFNVGDSKVFEEEGGYLGQISVDDSPPGPKRSGVVIQTLGGAWEPTRIHPHTGSIEYRSPARYLICSDGLTDAVPLEMIEEAMKGADDAELVQDLIDEALEAGAPDNVSIVVARLTRVGWL